MSPADDIPVEIPYIEVLRLGHRPDRDKRITTHVALLSRAFGARGIHVDTKDVKLEGTIRSVGEQFGGNFFIRTGHGRKGVMKGWKGTIVHLTMYGAPLEESVKRIPFDENILVIVGAEKVPRDVYDLAHFNVSVANQPHSEVSSLALFLDRICEGKQLDLRFDGGRSLILPDNTGKNVIDKNNELPARKTDPHSKKWGPIPSRDECMDLLVQLGVSRPVLDHVRAVHELGMKMVETSRKSNPDQYLDVDPDLLEAGLLLHDLGRSVTHSIKHVDRGAEIARELGLDDRIVSMIANHIGAGVTAEEAEELGLIPVDHVPGTLMERIVAHADDLVGNRKRRSLASAMEHLEGKGAHNAAVRMHKLHLELEEELGIDIDILV
ncbi:MAG: HDIG domain-containing protein [Candidatus Thermoplasmatota archaeon]|nr:HDIG domain-containing protein [Candidatus Thermoplasmatota archaeon]